MSRSDYRTSYHRSSPRQQPYSTSSSTRHRSPSRRQPYSTSSSTRYRSSSRQQPYPTSHNYRAHKSAEYPNFHIDDSCYELVFLNKDTSIEQINSVLDHVQASRQYSVDTESEKANNELSLIQINLISKTLPSLVLLFELNHFPKKDSGKYGKFFRIFQLIFRFGNEIYSWGNITKELEPVKHLFDWPIPAKPIDLQPYFPHWYNRARTRCGVQNLSQVNIQRHEQQQSCECHPVSMYKEKELWSLQNAYKFGCKLFIDKTCRLSHWSQSLSSSNSMLSHHERITMIDYAVHDVLAVTFLIRPITENWTFNQVDNRNIGELFIGFESIKLPPLPQLTNKKKNKNINLEKFSRILHGRESDSTSSDDEIHLHQLIKRKNSNGNEDIDMVLSNIKFQPAVQKPVDDDILSIDTSMENINGELIAGGDATENLPEAEGTVDIVQLVPDLTEQQPQRRKKIRSAGAKKKQNKKRNDHLRLLRYRHVLERSYYYRFRLKLIRKILRYYGVSFRHVKFHGDEVIIGVKNAEVRKEYEETLPSYCFDKRNYWRFKK